MSLPISKATALELKKKCSPFLKRVAEVSFDEGAIVQLITELSDPLPTVGPIVGQDERRKASKLLQLIQRRRSRLTQTRVSLINKQHYYSIALEGIEARARAHPDVTSLKNEPTRWAVITYLARDLPEKLARVKNLVDQADNVLWTLKDNQMAIASQIKISEEERWDAQTT
jgi:hypothetical protein